MSKSHEKTSGRDLVGKNSRGSISVTNCGIDSSVQHITVSISPNFKEYHFKYISYDINLNNNSHRLLLQTF